MTASSAIVVGAGVSGLTAAHDLATGGCEVAVPRSLHLVGEHTVPEYFGTVHGAFVSGRRAVAAVLGGRRA